jgi:hypothetical protein
MRAAAFASAAAIAAGAATTAWVIKRHERVRGPLQALENGRPTRRSSG